MLEKKESIIKYLKEHGATESNLCEVCGTDTVYFVIPTDIEIPDGEYIGSTIIKCEDGFIELPICDYDRYGGFEQYDLSNVKDISKDVVWEYIQRYTTKIKLMEKMSG